MASNVIHRNLFSLQDPDDVLKGDHERLLSLQQKMSTAISKLFVSPERGGNPLLFMLVQPKKHILATELRGMQIKTAATDGERFYWNPDFLDSLNFSQVKLVMNHEIKHVYLYHCDKQRSEGWDHRISGVAFDLLVNGFIEIEHNKISSKAGNEALFGGPLGRPLTLKMYLDWIDGTAELPEETCCFSDPKEAATRSAESIYFEIQSHHQSSPRRCKKENGGCDALSINPKTGLSNIPKPWAEDSCEKCGATFDGAFGNGQPNTMDAHVGNSGKVSKEKLMVDLMKAASAVSHIPGAIPGEIESLLKELAEPTLTPHDLALQFLQKRVKDAGDLKDYTRYARRPSYIYEQNASGEYVPMHKLYKPKTFDVCPKWVALLDTSGSMRDEDIAFGLKEVKLLATMPEAEGYIVPVDAEPHWNKMTKVESTTDIRRTQVVGRGGTVFKTFFEELPQKIGRDIDFLMIITDGFLEHIPAELNPGCAVLWVITSKNNTEFKPTFGKVCHL